MAELSFVTRMQNLARIHWNGLCYIIVPLVFLPLVFEEPLLENRTLFVMLVAFCWFASEAMTGGIIGVLPIIFYPFFGIMSSKDACMAYARDSQMVLHLSFYIAIVIFHSKLDRYLALHFLQLFGINPLNLLTILMVATFLLAAMIPDACACSIMMPLTSAILDILEEIDVCSAIDEDCSVDDDEKPCPSDVANAFYIGVGYAATIGGTTSLWASEAGFELMQIYNDIFINAQTDVENQYEIIALPFSIILLAFTIGYLKVLYMGLMRSEDRKIYYDSDVSTSDLLNMAEGVEESRTLHMTLTLCLVIFYLVVLIGVKLYDIHNDSIEPVYRKYSMFIMIILFLAFVCPKSCDFCNYFLCREPNEYKESPSILPWLPVNKYMAWNQFFVYGSGIANGIALERSGMDYTFAGGLVNVANIPKRQLGFTLYSVLFTTIAANQLVAKSMMMVGAKSAVMQSQDPSLFTIPIMLASSLSFLMPVSSVTTSFTAGWGNVRTRQMFKAGIGPLIFGYILIYICITIGPMMTSAFSIPLYPSTAMVPNLLG